MKNTIRARAAVCRHAGTNNAIAAIISNIPVPQTICFFNGKNDGIIRVMPFEKAKWAILVKSSITLMAMLPASETFHPPLISFMSSSDSINVAISTNKGFITAKIRRYGLSIKVEGVCGNQILWVSMAFLQLSRLISIKSCAARKSLSILFSL